MSHLVVVLQDVVRAHVGSYLRVEHFLVDHVVPVDESFSVALGRLGLEVHFATNRAIKMLDLGGGETVSMLPGRVFYILILRQCHVDVIIFIRLIFPLILRRLNLLHQIRLLWLLLLHRPKVW